MLGRVLTIAGSDPSGGAGIQADIKTITALGGYAATAITALTVQNTQGVQNVHAIDASIVSAQIHAVLDDVGADVIKIGMVGEVDIARAIATILENEARHIPVVLDPVLVATSGDRLAARGLVDVLRKELLPRTFIITPNADEAARLTQGAVTDKNEQEAAAMHLLAFGAENVLVKGGHIDGAVVNDILVSRSSARVFSNARIKSSSTHGTGCTLASAIAVGIAQGLPLNQAVERAISYVRAAIKAAPGFGRGNGPLNHICAPIDR